jgi:hypothetical protein
LTVGKAKPKAAVSVELSAPAQTFGELVDLEVPADHPALATALKSLLAGMSDVSSGDVFEGSVRFTPGESAVVTVTRTVVG